MVHERGSRIIEVVSRQTSIKNDFVLIARIPFENIALCCCSVFGYTRVFTAGKTRDVNDLGQYVGAGVNALPDHGLGTDACAHKPRLIEALKVHIGRLLSLPLSFVSW